MEASFRVNDVFKFSDGIMVIAVTPLNNGVVTLPAVAAVEREGQLIATICLNSERMPGPTTSPGDRVFQTSDVIELTSEEVKGTKWTVTIGDGAISNPCSGRADNEI